MQDLVDLGEVTDYADLARLARASRARITQIMNLLHLAPDIQETILHVFASHVLHRQVLLCSQNLGPSFTPERHSGQRCGSRGFRDHGSDRARPISSGVRQEVELDGGAGPGQNPRA